MTTATPASAAKQAEFPELVAALGVGGPQGLPVGVGELKAKEVQLVTHYLQTGNLTQAAIAVGFKAETALISAHKMLGKPEVRAFYRKCLGQVANNASETVMRVYERAVQAHHAADEAFQRMMSYDQEALGVEGQKATVSEGKESSHVTTSTDRIRLRERAAKEWERACRVANATDTLLAGMLGKLNINVSGEMKVIHVTKEKLEVMAAMRRDVVRSRADGGKN